MARLATTAAICVALIPASLGLEPLLKTYHEKVDGEWVGPMIFDEKALKALDEKLGNDLNQNLRASNRPRRSALEVMVEQHGRRMLDTCAAEGNVALTTVEGTAEQSDVTGESAVRAVGSSIFGPFEAGFGSQQDFLITAFGCSDASLCYSDGGIDTQMAEATCAAACGITLPRWDGDDWVGFLDTCGGHASDFHFHQSMHCLYEDTGSHSTKVAEGTNSDATPLYGKWEDYDNGELPELDACGGHYGYTPESPSTEVYHHHVQDNPPFAFGCYGPNDDGSLVTVEQCRAIYSDCDGSLETLTTYEGDFEYDAWCPCWDGSGLGYNGGGLNTGVDIVPLPATSGTSAPTMTYAPTPTPAPTPLTFPPTLPPTARPTSASAGLPTDGGPPTDGGGSGPPPGGGSGPPSGSDDGDDSSGSSSSGFCATDGSDATYTETIDTSTNLRTITTNHCPNHVFTNAIGDNPNSAYNEDNTYTIPLYPEYDTSEQLDLSAKGAEIGVTFNGAMIFSSFAGPSVGAATDYSLSATYIEGDTFDECGGHSSTSSAASYHIHVPPSCLLTQLGQTDDAHSPQIDWALDGFQVYGPRGPNGVMMQTCTITGGTYGTDVCTDDCAGYYADTGDGYVYRYYVLGDYHCLTDDSCETPTNPLPGAEYFPFTMNCFNGCMPSGVDGSYSSLNDCSSSSESGTTDDFAAAAVDTLAQNTDSCLAAPSPTGSPVKAPTVAPGSPTKAPVKAPTAPPATAPTAAPEKAPTKAPTASATTTEVTWSTTLSMTGFSAADITDDDEASIVDSIAAGSDDITADDITITSITDSTSRRVRSRSRSLLATGVDIEYDTTVVLEETSYTDTDALFTAVTTDTENYVTSGDFEMALQASGSTTLAAVDVSEDSYTTPTTYTSVDLSPTPAPTAHAEDDHDDHDDHDHDDHDHDDDGADAAGIDSTLLIIIVAVVVVLGGCGYFMMGKKKQVAPE